jgi:hypothetical protein
LLLLLLVLLLLSWSFLFQTNCCVESTMRTGYEKGFKVFTITDACAATR